VTKEGWLVCLWLLAPVLAMIAWAPATQLVHLILALIN
jgi:hypothetical protein